jgi:hypothetical protein
VSRPDVDIGRLVRGRERSAEDKEYRQANGSGGQKPQACDLSIRMSAYVDEWRRLQGSGSLTRLVIVEPGQFPQFFVLFKRQDDKI